MTHVSGFECKGGGETDFSKSGNFQTAQKQLHVKIVSLASFVTQSWFIAIRQIFMNILMYLRINPLTKDEL